MHKKTVVIVTPKHSAQDAIATRLQATVNRFEAAGRIVSIFVSENADQGANRFTKVPFIGGTELSNRSIYVLSFLANNYFDEIHFLDAARDGFLVAQAKNSGILFRNSELSATQEAELDIPKNFMERNKLQYCLEYFKNTSHSESAVSDRYPSITICVPYYNKPQFLEQLLRSLKRNKYPNFHVVIVDDGSTQASAIEKFRELASSPEFLTWTFLSKENQGPGATRNFAASQSKSDFLIFLDSDNIACPTLVEDFVECMQFSGADCLSCWFYAFQGDSEINDQTRIEYAFYPMGPCLKVGIYDNIFGDTTFCIRRSVFEKLGGFNEKKELRLEDWELFSRLALSGCRLDVIPKVLFYYRQVDGSWGRNIDFSSSRELITENYLRLRPDLVLDVARNLVGPVFLELTRLKTENSRLNRALEDLCFIGKAALLVRPFVRCFLKSYFEARKPNIELSILPAIRQRVPEVDSSGFYQSDPEPPSSIRRIYLENIRLCLYHYDYDFVLISSGLEYPPTIRIKDIGEQTIMKKGLQNLFAPDNSSRANWIGRIVRFWAEGGERKNLREIFPNQSLYLKKSTLQIGAATQSATKYFPFSDHAPTFLEYKKLQKPVIFVSTVYLAMGGVERNTIEIIKHLKNIFDFIVIAHEPLAESQGSLAGEFGNVAHSVYEFAEIAEQEHYLDLFRHLKKAYQPDLIWIVNGSKWQADHATEIRELFREIPIIDQQVYDTKLGWIARFDEKGIQASDRFIAINERIRDVFLKRFAFSADRVDLIYSALNSDLFGPTNIDEKAKKEVRASFQIPNEQPLYLMVGRLTSQKRPMDFVRLAQWAQKNHIEGTFVIVGDGELKPELDRFIAKHGLKNVRLLGFQKELTKIYQVSTGLIILSAYEGLPISMLEAMACGVPILATNVGDIEPILRKYKLGKVIQKVGDINQIRNAFREWVNDLPNLRTAALDNAELVRTRFSAYEISKSYEKCFNRAMADKKHE